MEEFYLRKEIQIPYLLSDTLMRALQTITKMEYHQNVNTPRPPSDNRSNLELHAPLSVLWQSFHFISSYFGSPLSR